MKPRTGFRNPGMQVQTPIVEFAVPDGWTYQDLQTALCEAVCDKYGMEGHYDKGTDAYVPGVYPWLRNFDNVVVWYSLDGSDVYQESYTVDGTEVTLDDDQIEVKVMWNAVPSTADKAEAFSETYELSFGGDVVRFAEDMAVVRTGLIFKAGDYPDKNFSITPEELKAAADAFVPVPNHGAHVPTIFDGKMGQLKSVEVGEDGISLFGTIEIPKWMQEIHGPDNPMKASLEWTRDTKRIFRNTIIPNPRVTESALMAAFSTSTPTPEKKPSFGEVLRALLGLDKPIVQKVVPMSTTNETTDQTAAIAKAIQDGITAGLAGVEAKFTARFDQQEKQIAAFAATTRGSAIDQQVERLFQNRVIFSAQIEPLKALLAAAHSNSGTVTFAATEEGGQPRTVNFAQGLEAVLLLGPKHNLNIDTIPQVAFTLGAIESKTANMTEADEIAQQVKETKEWAAKQGPQVAGAR